ncbi:MAG: hypothetical protein M3O67_04500 [Bacteroidota bacterium]|nr:hypothetical protein [Bacteroidota bacterium]
MKRFIVSILAVFYLSTSMGATIHLHYCMDKLVAWNLGKNKDYTKACPFCGMAKTTNKEHCGKQTKGCCKDEQKQVKLENDQKVTEAAIHLAQISAEAITPIFSDYYSFKYASSLTEDYPVIHAPPQSENVALFVLNCVFRI